MQIKLLQQSIQHAKAEAENSEDASNKVLDELQAAKMILQGHGPGGDMRKLLKQKQPSLISWLLGPRTNVISTRVSSHERLHTLVRTTSNIKCSHTGLLHVLCPSLCHNRAHILASITSTYMVKLCLQTKLRRNKRSKRRKHTFHLHGQGILADKFS